MKEEEMITHFIKDALKRDIIIAVYETVPEEADGWEIAYVVWKYIWQ